MWPTFTWGFVSIVQKQSDIENDTLTVRSRDAQSLEEFAKRAGREGYKAEFDMATDYPFRDVFTRDEVAQVMVQSVHEIRYSNFKNAAKAARGQTYGAMLGRWWTASHMMTPADITKRARKHLSDLWKPSEQDRIWASQAFAPDATTLTKSDVRDVAMEDDEHDLSDDEWAQMDDYLDKLENARGMARGTLTHLDLTDNEWTEFWQSND